MRVTNACAVGSRVRTLTKWKCRAHTGILSALKQTETDAKSPFTSTICLRLQRAQSPFTCRDLYNKPAINLKYASLLFVKTTSEPRPTRSYVRADRSPPNDGGANTTCTISQAAKRLLSLSALILFVLHAGLRRPPHMHFNS